uniref:Coronin n=1 Tax=Macrostomum lignano TaxID=282301 RepID=A0A1I8IL17_9PLAT
LRHTTARWPCGADCRLCSTIGHPDHVNSIAWSPDGRLLASTCKDRLARVMDPRSGCTVAKWTCHTGAKISKILFSDDCRLLTTGFSEYSQRQYALWDLNKTSRALHSDEVDSSSGVLLPYYDPDCSLLYLAGRGDGNIRFYEISRGRLHFLNQFSTHSPQKCIAQLPKRALDRSLCEVGRLYRLHVASNVVEPVRVIAPRRGHHVSDIYPPAAAPIPALGADQWLAGANRDPVRVSLSTGEIINPPLPPPQKPQSPPQAPQAQSSSSNGGDPTHQLTPGTLRNIQHLVQAASPPRPTLNSETAASTPADPAAAAPDTAATAAPAGTSCGPEKFSRLPGGDASAAVSNSACGPTADMDSSSGRPDAVSTEELTSQLAAKDVELSSLRKELAFRDMRLMRLEKELQSKESELVYLRTLLRRYGDSRSSQC